MPSFMARMDRKAMNRKPSCVVNQRFSNRVLLHLSQEMTIEPSAKFVNRDIYFLIREIIVR